MFLSLLSIGLIGFGSDCDAANADNCFQRTIRCVFVPTTSVRTRACARRMMREWIEMSLITSLRETDQCTTQVLSHLFAFCWSWSFHTVPARRRNRQKSDQQKLEQKNESSGQCRRTTIGSVDWSQRTSRRARHIIFSTTTTTQSWKNERNEHCVRTDCLSVHTVHGRATTRDHVCCVTKIVFVCLCVNAMSRRIVPLTHLWCLFFLLISICCLLFVAATQIVKTKSRVIVGRGAPTGHWSCQPRTVARNWTNGMCLCVSCASCVSGERSCPPTTIKTLRPLQCRTLIEPFPFTGKVVRLTATPFTMFTYRI